MIAFNSINDLKQTICSFLQEQFPTYNISVEQPLSDVSRIATQPLICISLNSISCSEKGFNQLIDEQTTNNTIVATYGVNCSIVLDFYIYSNSSNNVDIADQVLYNILFFDDLPACNIKMKPLSTKNRIYASSFSAQFDTLLYCTKTALPISSVNINVLED